jgi:hypothetical protein
LNKKKETADPNLRDKLIHVNCQPQKKISQALLRPLQNGSYTVNAEDELSATI